MASGDPMFLNLQPVPPGANTATLDTRTGGSTPAETVPVIDFDDTSDEYMDFRGTLSPKYGGGLTLTLPWSATSATTGSVRLRAAFRRIADDAEDIDAAHSYDFNEVTDAAANVSGEISYPTITFTDGTDMDDLAAGEEFILRVGRKPSDTANDTMTGDAELWGVWAKET